MSSADQASHDARGAVATLLQRPAGERREALDRLLAGHPAGIDALTLALAEATTAHARVDLETARALADLARQLRGHGLVVHEGVGSSADPVDLGVEDPHRPGRLVLAVESDGPQYAAMRTTRDRDRLRAEQLERLGWRHLRVWSTDVFRDPARDVARILKAVGVRDASGE